tara:strand:- start:676 stop:1107 length:432 start_codon:yes stop_codon:yes gene_type:complete
MFETIYYEKTILAQIIYSNYKEEGIKFFTPPDYSQQLGYMNRKKGYVIPPHVHNPIPRKVIYTQEVLLVKKGKLRVDFYDNQKNYLESRILKDGDVILLSKGGHGFEMIEDTEIIEVKQGPFAGEKDKERFIPISSDKLKFTK